MQLLYLTQIRLPNRAADPGTIEVLIPPDQGNEVIERRHAWNIALVGGKARDDIIVKALADSSLVANTPGCPDSLGWLDGSSETQADGH